MQNVKSSIIDQVGLENGVLTVKLHSGKTYQWDNVTQDLFQSFVESDSPGRFFNKNIVTLSTTL